MNRRLRLLTQVAVDTPRFLLEARRRYHGPLIALLRRMALLLRRRFKPDYSFSLGMLAPGYTDEQVAESLSKRELVNLQDRLNPASWTVLAVDKSIFYRYAAAHGLPVPPLLAVWFRNTAGWSPEGPLDGGKAWEDFFLRRVPAEFIVKPSEGLYGYGFRYFRRNDSLFTDQCGVTRGAAALPALFREDPRFDGYVVQPRLVSHPDLRRLSGSDAVQCVRIVTLIRRDGTPEVIHAHMKIIVGGNIVDNIDKGKTGNIHGVVDAASGIMTGGNIMSLDGSGNRPCTHHPGTGVLMAGMPVPLWREACAATLAGARAFAPLRTIGWDVALTPDGPLLLEANNWFDPPPMRQGVSMRELVARLRAELPG